MKHFNYIDHITALTQYPDREKAYFELVNLYMQGPDEVRLYIREHWDFGVFWVLPKTHRLACTQGERYSCRQKLLASLAYDAIAEKDRVDMRESIMGLAVIYHSCVAAKIDPEKLFNDVIAVASDETRTMLTEFRQRNTKEKALFSFGFVAVKNVGGETEIIPTERYTP